MMTGKLHTTRCLCSAVLLISLLVPAGLHARPVSVIFDTDLSSDVDDVGAIAVLHALADQQKVDILGMMISSGDPWSASCADVLNTWFGRKNIAVGIVTGDSVTDESKYTETIASSYERSGKHAVNSIELYRKLLSEAPDNSVTIISVGYLTNLAALIQSQADDISRLEGRQLVEKKVKQLVCMGGTYPSGREWNFYRDSQSTAAVVSSWPGPILFCGYEQGRPVLTGAGLRNTPRENPISRAYELYNGLTNRPSWDQLTVLIGSAGDQPLDGVPGLFSVNRGVNAVGDDGSNRWTPQPDGPHGYATFTLPADRLAEKIEALMASSVEKAVNSE